MLEKLDVEPVLEEQAIEDLEVDRHEEMVITQLPGYTATEKIVRDVAAERRLRWYLFSRYMWTLMAFLEILLAFRVVLRLIAANPASGFAVLIYGITGVFIAPFVGLVGTPILGGGAALEISTLIGMVVYALVFLGLTYCVRLFVDHPHASLFIRTTREQSPGIAGSVRTTQTTIANKRL